MHRVVVMSVKAFAAQMRQEIESLKSQGTASIYCDNLISYLSEIERSPEPEISPLGIENYKADLQNWVESNKHLHEFNLEMFRSVISSGQNALKSMFLLNGGASVALLAFIGHLAQFRAAMVNVFSTCLLPFVIGVLVIAMASGFTYLSQWLYAGNSPKSHKWGLVVNILCIILGFASCGFFIWGICRSYSVFLSYT